MLCGTSCATMRYGRPRISSCSVPRPRRIARISGFCLAIWPCARTAPLRFDTIRHARNHRADDTYFGLDRNRYRRLGTYFGLDPVHASPTDWRFKPFLRAFRAKGLPGDGQMQESPGRLLDYPPLTFGLFALTF